MRALKRRFPEVVRAAVEAGVPIYAGTDAGGGIDHGLIAEEMWLLHERAGMSATEAVLRAASWGAREWLGFPGLVEGGLADLVAYDEDPRGRPAGGPRPEADHPAGTGRQVPLMRARPASQ